MEKGFFLQSKFRKYYKSRINGYIEVKKIKEEKRKKKNKLRMMITSTQGRDSTHPFYLIYLKHLDVFDNPTLVTSDRGKRH